MIVGICGSPKKERSNTRYLLEKALEAASDILSEGKTKRTTTVLLNISDFEIRHCTGCDTCVRKKPCPESEHDDMPKIEENLLKADGIIIAAPSYFTTVPGVLKDFIDRSRPMKMLDHQLKDKLFGAITYAGLRYGGQEHVIDYLNRYALGQGMIVIGAVGNPVRDGTFGSGSMQTDEGEWRSAKKDQLAIEGSQQLGRRMAELVKKLK
ncbi:MAG: flavodoxin family protein [Candidatus Thorarchaeota archaeon]|nr:MAG: flavodoxin family protein [Candidatus Thorarchaeota archaeon]